MCAGGRQPVRRWYPARVTGDPPTSSTTRGLVLLEQVGAGGFGEVYRARLETAGGLTRAVAVKLLRNDAVDESMIARMADEAHLLAALAHPVVLDVEDLTVVDGRSAIISEFVDGLDLGEVLPVPPGAAMRIVARVAEALHSAWATPGPSGQPMQIVHRDIKPSNIRVGRGGVVKLLDFGIARSATAHRRVKTETGVVIGSMGFFAPERWSGDDGGHESDVYALGCVLFEALTGQPALRGLTVAHQIGLAHDEMSHDDYLGILLSKCPDHAGVRDLVASMMAYHAGDRPTAAHVAVTAHRLAGALDGDLFSWSNALPIPPAPAAADTTARRLVEHRGQFVEPTLPSPARADPAPVAPAPPKPGSRRRRTSTAAVAVLGGGVGLAAVVVAGLGLVVGLAAWNAGWLGSGASSMDVAGATEPAAVVDAGGPGGEAAQQGAVRLDAQANGSPDALNGSPDALDGSVDDGEGTPAVVAGADLDDNADRDGSPTGTSTDGATRLAGELGDGAPEPTDVRRPHVTDSGRTDRSSTTPRSEPSQADGATAGVPGTSADGSTPDSSQPDVGAAAAAIPARTEPVELVEVPVAAPAVSVTVAGGVPVRLRGPRGPVSVTDAAPGDYTLEASFADGVWRDMGPLTLSAGKPILIRCAARFRKCEVEGG